MSKNDKGSSGGSSNEDARENLSMNESERFEILKQIFEGSKDAIVSEVKTIINGLSIDGLHKPSDKYLPLSESSSALSAEIRTQIYSDRIEPRLLTENYKPEQIVLLIYAALEGKIALCFIVHDPDYHNPTTILTVRLNPNQILKIWQAKPNTVRCIFNLYNGDNHEDEVGIHGVMVDQLEANDFLSSVSPCVSPTDSDFIIERLSARQLQERRTQIQSMSLEKRSEQIKKRGLDIYKELLGFKPSQYLLWTQEVSVNGDNLCFEIINWHDNEVQIKDDASRILEGIRTMANNIKNQVDSYNSGLSVVVTNLVKQRKAELLRQNNLLENLGVPIKLASDVPLTFCIPIQKREIIIQKPISSNATFAPEPTISNEIYQHILRVCHHTGIEMERHPGLYENKDEEAIREMFLLTLSPHFQSVTGETFNKSGKTDILIRHEGKNVFVSECKIWRGKVQHQEAIDQLLGYLTWRDSKGALFYFVKNKELQPVLDQIESATPSHACYVKNHGKKEEGWYCYHFHIIDDSTRGVDLTIMVFHFN